MSTKRIDSNNTGIIILLKNIEYSVQDLNNLKIKNKWFYTIILLFKLKNIVQLLITINYYILSRYPTLNRKKYFNNVSNNQNVGIVVIYLFYGNYQNYFLKFVYFKFY